MQRLLLALGVLLCCYSYSNAQVSTGTSGQTGDIIVLGNGWTGNFSQCTHYVDCWSGTTDNGDIHNAPAGTTGNGSTFYWSGAQQTLTNTIAIQTALQAAGIQIDGFDYQWVFKNGNANHYSNQSGGGAVDPFEVVVDVYDSNGNLFKSYKYDYGNQFYGWTYDQGTELFSAIGLSPSYFGNVVVSVTGQDIANQAGYWGPEFRADESYLYVNYSADVCYQNQLYDPACPGYANALYNQQCTANPLYDPGCPGYKTALLNSHCAANPLYDPACPGYTTAYYNQQCTADPTSDPGCPDYYVAMCEENALFDPGCTGYDTAYFEEQCMFDPQYDTSCSGYVDLSGNDGDFTVLDPLIDDVVNAEVEVGAPDFYSVPTDDFMQDDFVVEQETVELDDGFQMVEDDIEEEIGELEMVDDIDSEIAALESESTEEGSPVDAMMGGAKQEDDIEKELQALEEDADKGDDESVAPEDIQIASEGDDIGAQPAPGRSKPKPNPVDTKRNKLRLLIAMKAIEAVKELEAAVSLEQQMNIQRRLLALISFVPDFKDYAEKENINQVNFYPPKPTVDHAYARWFLNDSTFGAMEDLQYQ